jgi:hypothetical protein
MSTKKPRKEDGKDSGGRKPRRRKRSPAESWDVQVEAPVNGRVHKAVITGTSMHARGSLAEWQEHVASKATGNPVLLFSLSASFGRPLLKPAGLEGGGFHLHGLTSRGKTTQLQMAGSVWGCGADPSAAPDRAFLRK